MYRLGTQRVGSAPVRFDYNNRTDDGTSSSDEQNERGHEVSLPIDEAYTPQVVALAKSLRNQLKIKHAFPRACCIYKVPDRLRNLNEKAYTPRVVFLGPIHYRLNHDRDSDMEVHKKMYLQQFLERSFERSKVREENLIDIIMKNEKKLRDCYAETIHLNQRAFARMILMDAVFIIMVLLNLRESTERRERESTERRERGRSDHIFFRPWKLGDVLFDMCLLENQLPFFILEKLFVLLAPQKYTIHELTSWFLRKQWKEWVKEDSNPSGILHFVDFLRKCQQPTGWPSGPPAGQETYLRAPTATELYQAGVKFDLDPSKNLLSGVTFHKGLLKSPQLLIHDGTEILFRNLHAFEQCHHMSERTFVSDYINFISCLVTAPNDVEVLAQNKILKHMLRSNEAVSNLLGNLDKENFISRDSFFWGMCKELDEYCRKPWHRWKAYLQQVHFKNPWTAISVIAAGVLLILTVIQTVCSVLQVR